jgi:hypothetical protein
VCHSPELLAAYHGLHRLRVPRHPPHAFLRLTTKSSSRNTRVCYRNLPIASPHPALALTSQPGCTMSTAKIPFPTNQSSTKRPKVDDPSSVLHFSNSDRDQANSRGEPCIVNGRCSCCKCRRPDRFPSRTEWSSKQTHSSRKGAKISQTARPIQVDHHRASPWSPCRSVDVRTRCGAFLGRRPLPLP